MSEWIINLYISIHLKGKCLILSFVEFITFWSKLLPYIFNIYGVEFLNLLLRIEIKVSMIIRDRVDSNTSLSSREVNSTNLFIMAFRLENSFWGNYKYALIFVVKQKAFYSAFSDIRQQEKPTSIFTAHDMFYSPVFYI